MDPILKIYKLSEYEEISPLVKLSTNLGIKLTKEECELEGKKLRKVILS